MITFLNRRNEFIEFASELPFRITKIEGLGGAEADVQTQKSPYQDGETHIDSPLKPRPISIEFAIHADNRLQLYEYRKQMTRIFNARLGEGLLTYNFGGVGKEIKAAVESGPIFPDGKGNETERYQRGLLNLICPNPYWKSPQIEEEPTFEALFEFPFEGEFEMGIQRDTRIIDNDGDSPTPIQVEFYGPAVNPIIRNLTTGEFIKVNQTLGENELMKIDTTPGIKSVYFVGADGAERNVFNWIDLDSTFFQLQIGENEIEYSADSDIQGAIVNIYYQKLYVGV
ncbi:phage tail family protein [Robertmurraya kyonggiensis]|nr:phage tail family protein [Robertmurraya kyonggiensis]